MATTIYSNNVDLTHLNVSHSLAVLSVPPGSRVLDLGAADGSVARALKDRGCTVWGVEQDERAAEAAREICARVVTADLETEDAWRALEGETFDAILALDVLEHLRQPVPVLKRAAHHLKSSGMVIVSLPNVTHGSVRLNLLKGHFDYTPLGLLDRTHLRFFDRQSAEKLMADSGLVISERLRVKRGLDETEVPVVKEDVPPGFVDFVERDPDATTYQFVFIARRDDSVSEGEGAMLSERLLADNEALREQLLRVERYARDLQNERTATGDAVRERDELRDELGRRMADLHALHRDLRHARSEIAVKDAFIADLRTELEKRQNEIENLRRYADSAGFRLVERVISILKRVPFLYEPLRSLVRKSAGTR